MNRVTPTFTTNYAGGARCVWWTPTEQSATAYLHQNGTIGTDSTTCLLPFTPRSGYVYTLTASVTVPAMTAGKWITMGFAEYTPPLNTCTDPRFGSTEVSGNPWTYLTEGSGNDHFFPTRTLDNANANLMPTAGTYTVQLVLDTTGSSWKASEFVNGTQVGSTYTYTSNPLITAFGVGQTTLTSNTGIQWNYVTLSSTGSGTVNTVSGSVSFSGTGKALNPTFIGLSYDKAAMTTTNRFNTNNASMLGVCSLLDNTILRIGGGTVDTTGWNGISNTIPITPAQVDSLAAFVKALPSGWKVIYGVNLLSNTPDNCASEAVYVANALGSRLYGFEIGNEPEFGFTQYSTFLGRWRLMAAAITNHVAGWAVTNGGVGWVLTGADAGQGQLAAFTDPFATNEAGTVALLTQHYYKASAGASSDTMQFMLQMPDSTLNSLVANIVGAATGHCSLGSRIDESGSFSGGGIVGLSDAYGSGLWALDEMFTMALNGCQGINYHGGGRSPYSPIVDGDGTSVVEVEPEFYAMGMMAMLPEGNAVPATITGGASSLNFTAYGVKSTDGGNAALLNNKEVDKTVSATVTLGSGVASAQMIELTAPQLFCTNDFTLGGAPINPDGSWSGGVQQVLIATNGQVTVNVPPISAVLLIPYTWLGWDNPGGGIPTNGLTFTTAFAACSCSTNRIDVYGIGSDNQLYHTYWAGSGWLTPWELHTLPVAPAGGPGASANMNVANRMDAYFIGTDGNCYHQYWNGSTWSAWENLGTPSGTTLVGTPSATSWGSGRYDVYCQDAGHHVYRKYFSGGWSSWVSQGGTIAGDPASCTWAANRLDAFVIGTDNQIWHQYWNGSAFVPNSTGWQLDSGLPQTISPQYGLGACSWGSGRIDLFANTGTNIVHNWYSGGWNDNWNEPINPPVTPVAAPAAASWGANRIDLFILGSDGKCYHTYHFAP